MVYEAPQVTTIRNKTHGSPFLRSVRLTVPETVVPVSDTTVPTARVNREGVERCHLIRVVACWLSSSFNEELNTPPEACLGEERCFAPPD